MPVYLSGSWEDVGGWIWRGSTREATCSSCSGRGHSSSPGLLKGKTGTNLNFYQKRKPCDHIYEPGFRCWAALWRLDQGLSVVSQQKLAQVPAITVSRWLLHWVVIQTFQSVSVNSLRGFQICHPPQALCLLQETKSQMWYEAKILLICKWPWEETLWERNLWH